MSEKLDSQQKGLLVSLLPEGWGYYFTPGLIVVYQELPDLEVVRRVCVAGNEDKEVWVGEECFFLTYIGRDMNHWVGGEVSLMKTQISIRGNEIVVVVVCLDEVLGCKVLFLIKKKIA